MDKILYQFHFNFTNFFPTFIPFVMAFTIFFVVFIGPIIMKKLEASGKAVAVNPAVKTKGGIILKIVFAIISLALFLLFVMCALGYIAQYSNIISMMKNNQLKVVEGYVENFYPMPDGGHDTEHFDINGVFFDYSDSIISNGYNEPAISGGVITHNGQHLKIKYYFDNSTGNSYIDKNIILYIEQLP